MHVFTETHDPQLLRVREVAQILGQCPESVYAKVKTGELAAIRLGHGRAALRIPRDELERFLAAGRERV
jgi:excisionase family DNA binding protein